MGISKDDFLKIASALGVFDDEDKGSSDAEAQAKAKARAEAEARAKAEAEAQLELNRKVEEAKKAQQEAGERKEAEGKSEETSDELKALQAKLQEQKIASLKEKIVSGFMDKSFSRDDAESITEFFDYDKLLNQDGEVDDEKVSGMIEGVSSLSLRKPPRSNTSTDYSPSAGSLGKYLEKK